MRRFVAGSFALVIAAIATAGCGSSGATAEATASPSSSRSPVASSVPSSAAETPAPSAPAVPEGLPVMSGAELADPPPAEAGVIARWMIDAIGPDVYAFYLGALPAAGFEIDERFPGGNVAVIRFTTPAGTTLDLALVGEGNGDRTRVDLRLPEGP